MTKFVFHAFEARYKGGDCAVCTLWFERGDRIGYDEDSELVHEDCYAKEHSDYSYDEEPGEVFDLGFKPQFALNPEDKVCPDCNQVEAKNGSCGCD